MENLKMLIQGTCFKATQLKMGGTCHEHFTKCRYTPSNHRRPCKHVKGTYISAWLLALKEVIAYNYVSLVALLTGMIDEETLHQQPQVWCSLYNYSFTDGITAEL